MRGILLVVVSMFASLLAGEDFVHESFTLTVPAGFQLSSNQDAVAGDICVYQRPKENFKEAALFYVSASFKPVPARVEDASQVYLYQAGIEPGERRVADWNGTKILVAEGTIKTTTGAKSASYEFITTAYVPTYPTSITISVRGKPTEISELRGIMTTVLASLRPAQPRPPEPEPSDGGTTLGLFVIFGAMALVLLGGGAFLFLKRRAPPAPQQPYTPTYQPPTEPRMNPHKAPWED